MIYLDKYRMHFPCECKPRIFYSEPWIKEIIITVTFDRIPDKIVVILYEFGPAQP